MNNLKIISRTIIERSYFIILIFVISIIASILINLNSQKEYKISFFINILNYPNSSILFEVPIIKNYRNNVFLNNNDPYIYFLNNKFTLVYKDEEVYKNFELRFFNDLRNFLDKLHFNNKSEAERFYEMFGEIGVPVSNLTQSRVDLMTITKDVTNLRDIIEFQWGKPILLHPMPHYKIIRGFFLGFIINFIFLVIVILRRIKFLN